MSLAQILDQARSLTVPDKLHLIRVLVTDIDTGDVVEPLEHGRTYRLATPAFEPGAAEALLAAGATRSTRVEPTIELPQERFSASCLP